MKPEDNDIIGFLDNLIEEDPKLTVFEKEWAPLVSFLTEYEHLKAMKGLTQKSIAEACGTTQSAISRLERMRGKPSYQLLRRLSDAVGGSLFLSPTSEFAVSIPIGLQETARSIAEKRGLPTKDFLQAILEKGIANAEYQEAFHESDIEHIISLGSREIPLGEYGQEATTPGHNLTVGDYPPCTWKSAI